ncbi:hypothetical protein BV394_05410 [Brevirhabdus pacifica]|uniref:Uncharacterized protein n=2 Tax=Brevirhabdus pacifica TaxID=1267768 RepID=A0A1U7DGW4_9RHOB|nr:FkbM family methyltransferase [Brevirhabdus pacifica]APX89222.1 hypothetical protein BV394_05410 [Brevirhabdus pacifica]PJJ86173.1 FkbM family methyltransferase [Brevirhabdus pacifica]
MICAIITPIGPGHQKLFDESCAPSVRQAEDFDPGPFDKILHYAMDDTAGAHGRSARRNTALAQARDEGVDWIFFLDADDILAPNAFQAFGRVLADNPDLDVAWGLICEMDATGDPQLREGQPETIADQAAFLRTEPHLAVQIGGFYRTACVAPLGFDPQMDTGEDYKLYLQLWDGCRCAKLPEIFFLNRRGEHSVGPRSATGADWQASVSQQRRDALARTLVLSEPSHDGVAARMRVTNPHDLIQATHLAGRYFDSEGLQKLRRLCDAPAPHVIEVGANIGNHVVWYARHLNAARIYPVEPNPVALQLLNENLELNDLAPLVDGRGLGLGAGRQAGRFAVETPDADNLGATRLVPDAAGGIEVCDLDTLFADVPADIIKIDVEGMEVDVLAGANALIARTRPVIWIEVMRDNMLAVAQDWCRQAGYRITDSIAYTHTVDYFAVPKD